MDINRLRSRWQEQAIIDFPEAMKQCAEALQASSSLAMSLHLLRSTFQKAEQDFQEGTLSLQDRDVQINKARLGFYQLLQRLEAADLRSDLQVDVAESEVVPSLPELAITAPDTAQALSDFLPQMQAAIEVLLQEESTIFNELGDAFVPAGKWIERIGVKISENAHADNSDLEFINTLNALMDKAAEVFDRFVDELTPVPPRLERLYDWYDQLMKGILQRGESLIDQPAQQVLLADQAARLTQLATNGGNFRKQMASWEQVEQLIVLFAFHPHCYQQMQEAFRLIRRLLHLMDEFLVKAGKQAVELDLIFPGKSA